MGWRTLALAIKPRLCLGLVALLCLSSCMAVAIDQEVVDHDYQGAPKRILVFGTLDSGFSNAAADLFPGALQGALAQCGVQTEVYAPNHLQLNPEDRLRSMIARFKPDTVLLIHQSVQASMNGQVHSGTYTLTLKDIATKHDIWSAIMRLSGPSDLIEDRSKGASMFADRIVNRLATEGVLKACPAAITAPRSS